MAIMAMAYSEEPKRSKFGFLGMSAISFMMMIELFRKVQCPFGVVDLVVDILFQPQSFRIDLTVFQVNSLSDFKVLRVTTARIYSKRTHEDMSQTLPIKDFPSPAACAQCPRSCCKRICRPRTGHQGYRWFL